MGRMYNVSYGSQVSDRYVCVVEAATDGHPVPEWKGDPTSSCDWRQGQGEAQVCLLQGEWATYSSRFWGNENLLNSRWKNYTWNILSQYITIFVPIYKWGLNNHLCYDVGVFLPGTSLIFNCSFTSWNSSNFWKQINSFIFVLYANVSKNLQILCVCNFLRAFASWELTGDDLVQCKCCHHGIKSRMEITGIASQFAMQSRPICDASSHMRRNNCDA